MLDSLATIHYIVTLIFQTLDRAYGTLLLIGALGVVAQTILGSLHGGHGQGAHEAHSGDTGHIGHAHAGSVASAAPAHHTPVPHHGPDAVHSGSATPGNPVSGNPAAHAHREGAAQKGESGAINWLGLLSPLTIFSFCLGAGAVGLLVRAYMESIPTGLLATAGGVAFYRFGVRPVMALAYRFVSRPATNLSGAIAQEAVATGRFDAQGRGIVQITIDGEVKRLLARLDAQDQKRGVVVTSGDRLLITAIDPQKNACRVTRL